jgi:uncharacterized protein (TIGR00725 family)
MKPERRWRAIAVAGAGDCSATTAEIAADVGRRIGKAGCALVCGGLGGVMEAACRGAKEAGGLTIGILPGSDPASANPFVDVPVATGLGEARNALVARCCDSLIAIEGGFGTLSEIALALKMGKVVVSLGSWELPMPSGAKFLSAASPEEAVRLATAL